MNINSPDSRPQAACASLFRLPLELRQEIYSYLTSATPISHPLPRAGITSVSHKLLSPALLFANKQLSADVLLSYYAISTWKLILSHAFNFFRVDPNLDGLARSPILLHIQKVEVVFFCDILLLKDYPSFGMTQFCDEIRKRADRACEVLSQAEQLRSVTVSWIDTTMTGDRTEKTKTLLPLRNLAKSNHVSFRVGHVSGPDAETLPVFTSALRNVLGDSRCVGAGLACVGAAAPSLAQSTMDMGALAIDSRQDRQRLHEEPRSPRILSLSARCTDGTRRDLSGDQGLETLA